jgi:hypothetical protein
MTDAELNSQLLPGERIVWSGRPKTGLLLTRRDWIMVPFSLVWGGFAIFWESAVITKAGVPPFFPVVGGLFVLAGLYLVVGRFFFDAWIRGRTYYALTNERVLILRAGPFGQFTALSLDRLPDASLTERGNGVGTVRFGQSGLWGASNRSWAIWTPSLDPTPQFIAIDDARNVFNQIQTSARKRAS